MSDVLYFYLLVVPEGQVVDFAAWEIERCLSELLVLSVFVVPSLSLDFVREFADTVSIVVEEGPLVFKIWIVYEDSDSIAASVPVHVEFSDVVALAAVETLDLNLFPLYLEFACLPQLLQIRQEIPMYKE